MKIEEFDDDNDDGDYDEGSDDDYNPPSSDGNTDDSENGDAQVSCVAPPQSAVQTD